ncbi:class I SAM-dependent methyltransferase [Rubritalea marina]|uniref:class I SAM-dependent methyltransferase n=1 Tax=Rubritalea marina TaxID=361055 RepID=UPI0003A9FA98|nr:class I SAM-dependent methyltransferase [Rubritalea marina]
MAHEIVRQTVQPGDTVIDGTLGNGHDALFLAQLVGSNGLVVGFDVQKEAIVASQSRMYQNGIHKRAYQFYHAGHQHMLEYAKGPIAAIMFNLGYLPLGDKSVITQAETTLIALQRSLRILRHKGVLTVMCYPGHPGGAEEVHSIEKWVKQLPREYFRVMSYTPMNAPNMPAFMIAIEKN